jgi:hypothetical protein
MIAGLDVLEKLDFRLEEEFEDSNQFAHFADKDKITEAYVLGTPIIALCGRIFVPSRDPEKFPLCSICKEIMDALFLSPDE